MVGAEGALVERREALESLDHAITAQDGAYTCCLSWQGSLYKQCESIRGTSNNIIALP